ncbi:hypothetical protein J8TS2_08130 [Lederbergia ruris]|uniref:Secreted protein n=1 Tax=Lederbergia ruris TaxID=217495 RepID=A0ABQ4KEU0_9BACI|nr:hypothetical protein J8TS2_08130 [Lederbergia ruris]
MLELLVWVLGCRYGAGGLSLASYFYVKINSNGSVIKFLFLVDEKCYNEKDLKIWLLDKCQSMRRRVTEER